MLKAYTPFSLDGQAVAALALAQPTSGTFVVNSATQQAAYGLRFYGEQQSQSQAAGESWNAMAAKMTAWTLAAPQHHGFFPTVYDVERGVWSQDGYLVGGCAATGTWLLRWYTDLADDPTILHFVRRLGDGLVGLQRADGTFPQQEQSCSSSSEVVALFLAQLAQVTGDGGYTAALIRVCAALMAMLDNPEDVSDRSAAGLALLKTYRLSGDRAHLQAGLRLADSLAEMNDATPAELYAEAYRLTAQRSYAVHALQAVCRLPRPELASQADWSDLQGLGSWAILEANYPDVLLI